MSRVPYPAGGTCQPSPPFGHWLREKELGDPFPRSSRGSQGFPGGLSFPPQHGQLLTIASGS